MPSETLHYGQALVATHVRSEHLGGNVESMEERRKALATCIAAIRRELQAAVTWMQMQPGPVGLALYCSTPHPAEVVALSQHLLARRKGVYLSFDNEREYRAAVEADQRTEQLLLRLEAGGRVTPDAIEELCKPKRPEDDPPAARR